MSMTKNFYHDEIVARTGDMADAAFFATGDEPDETGIDYFADQKLAYDGYQEFECPLCGEMCDNDFGHSECHDREQIWADMRDEAYADPTARTLTLLESIMND